MLKPLKSSLIWRWRKGFKATSKAFYDAAHGAGGDYTAYMPDAAFRALALTNGPLSRAILNDKLLFEKIVAPHGARDARPGRAWRGVFAAAGG
jgi:hypothetical protein